MRAERSVEMSFEVDLDHNPRVLSMKAGLEHMVLTAAVDTLLVSANLTLSVAQVGMVIGMAQMSLALFRRKERS